jgi:ribosome-associated toxin RatA of RatAB toxin-antitoxin module
MMQLIYYTLFFSVLSSGSPGIQSSGWELKKDAEGIQIYTRSVDNSNVKEFKATGIVKASAKDILAVLKDVENYAKWIEDVKYSRKISQEENKMDFYYQIDLPWPMKDRDMALSMNISQTEDSIAVMLKSNNQIVADDEDFIRMNKVDGEWILYPIDATSCRVAYRFLADPEGSLPAWVVNLFIVDSPFKTLQNLSAYAGAAGAN